MWEYLQRAQAQSVSPEVKGLLTSFLPFSLLYIITLSSLSYDVVVSAVVQMMYDNEDKVTTTKME